MRFTSIHSWRLHCMLLCGTLVAGVAVPAVASLNRYPLAGTSLQQQQLQGTVKDAAGTPLQGVTVEPKDNPSAGTTTDSNGKFTLTLSGASKTIILRSVGFITQEVTPSGASVEVILQSQDASIDEVVVVGYGTQKKESVTGAISTVNSEDLSRSVA
ncbi:hypothetical protein HP439_17855, partial [Sphingobacterium shayense]|uniref:carboxypeptidase-like regulatory domain-containing protein n=1 Tax=Sphingobacterium shayense TaxID=626343 RepID=UPI001555A38A